MIIGYGRKEFALSIHCLTFNIRLPKESEFFNLKRIGDNFFIRNLFKEFYQMYYLTKIRQECFLYSKNMESTLDKRSINSGIARISNSLNTYY